MGNARVLIANAPLRSREASVHRTELLGIEYLAAVLRRNEHDVTVWDTTLREPVLGVDGFHYFGPTEEEAEGRIRTVVPDVVGISCHYASSASDAYWLARRVKAACPDALTVMGGLFVSIVGSQVLMECDALDYAIVGEAEESCAALLAGDSPETIDGLCWRDGSGVRANPKSTFIDDLDALPFPARDLVDLPAYRNGSRIKRLYGLGFRPSLSVLTSRSCPHRCSYCNMRLVHGSRWRARSADNVLAELEDITRKRGAEHVFVMDDNFTLSPERAKAICHGMAKRGFSVRWNTPNWISVKGMDAELAGLMRASGCANVCIAIETGDERLRFESMDKRVTNAEIAQAVDCLHKAGVPVVGFMLLGMPGEDEESFNETVRFLKTLPLTSLVVSFAMPFLGTRLYERLASDGTTLPDSHVCDDYNVPAFVRPEFTRDELIRRRCTLKELVSGLSVLYEMAMDNEATTA